MHQPPTSSKAPDGKIKHLRPSIDAVMSEQLSFASLLIVCQALETC